MRGSYDTVILLCTLRTQSFVNPGFEGEFASEKSIVQRTAQKNPFAPVVLRPRLSSARPLFCERIVAASAAVAIARGGNDGGEARGDIVCQIRGRRYIENLSLSPLSLGPRGSWGGGGDLPSISPARTSQKKTRAPQTAH